MPGGTQDPPSRLDQRWAHTRWKAQGPKAFLPAGGLWRGDGHRLRGSQHGFSYQERRWQNGGQQGLREEGTWATSATVRAGWRARRRPGSWSDVDRLLRSGSPAARRRKCARLVTELTRGWKAMEQEEPKCRSDSVDTEDSGYGGEPDERPEPDGGRWPWPEIKRPLPSSKCTAASQRLSPPARAPSSWGDAEGSQALPGAGETRHRAGSRGWARAGARLSHGPPGQGSPSLVSPLCSEPSRFSHNKDEATRDGCPLRDLLFEVSSIMSKDWLIFSAEKKYFLVDWGRDLSLVSNQWM